MTRVDSEEAARYTYDNLKEQQPGVHTQETDQYKNGFNITLAQRALREDCFPFQPKISNN